MVEIKREKVEIGGRKGKINRVRPGERLPDFDSLFDGELVPDPLADVEYTGDVEADTASEISEALKAIKREKRERHDHYRLLTDTEYWFAVCFQSREQKEEFLEKAGWMQMGDKYLDGLALAQMLKVEVAPIPLPVPNVRKAPKGLRENNLIRKGGDS